MLTTIPLAERRLDLAFIVFFAINLGFITYIVDIEQLIVADPSALLRIRSGRRAPLVDLVHWWGRSFDPPLMAREPWWRATIWLDVLGFGPFYAFAIYAFVKGRSFIRVPAIVWAGVMFANVTIILFEELLGAHKTPRPGMVVAANLPWLLMPWLVVARLARQRASVRARDGVVTLRRALRPVRGRRRRVDGARRRVRARARGAQARPPACSRGARTRSRRSPPSCAPRMASRCASPPSISARPICWPQVRAATAGLDVGLVVYNAAHSLIGPVPRAAARREAAHRRRELPRAARPRRRVRALHGRARARRHRAHGVDGRGAGLAARRHLRRDQGVRPGARRGAVGRARRARRRRARLPRRRHAHAQLRGVEAERVKVPLMEPEAVARRALDSLGKRPSVVPGFINRLGDVFMTRLLSRRAAIRFMGKTTRRLYPDRVRAKQVRSGTAADRALPLPVRGHMGKVAVGEHHFIRRLPAGLDRGVAGRPRCALFGFGVLMERQLEHLARGMAQRVAPGYQVAARARSRRRALRARHRARRATSGDERGVTEAQERLDSAARAYDGWASAAKIGTFADIGPAIDQLRGARRGGQSARRRDRRA